MSKKQKARVKALEGQIDRLFAIVCQLAENQGRLATEMANVAGGVGKVAKVVGDQIIGAAAITERNEAARNGLQTKH